MRVHGSMMAAAVTGVLVIGAGGLAAQTPDVELEITPMVGGALFLGDLPSSFEWTADGEPVVVTGAEVEESLALGGRAALRVSERLGIGGTVLYSPATLTSGSGAEADLGVWMYGLDVSYHALAAGARARPFVVGGVGGKTYDLEGFDTETDLMWNAGAGVDVALHPRASLRLEARDYMSLFDPELSLDEEIQHDLALTVGLNFNFSPGQRR